MLANDNALVAGLFTVNRSVQIDDAVVPLAEGVDFNSRSVGNFLIEAPQQFFTDDLRHDLTLRLVGGNVIREQEGALLGVFFTLSQQLVHPVSGFRGNGNDGVKGTGGRIDRDDLQQLVLLQRIDFVDGQNRGTVGCANPLDQGFLLNAHRRNRLHHKNGCVHIGNGLPDSADHVIAQFGTGLVVAGRVHKHKLQILSCHNAADAVAGGLRLIGNNGDLLPDQIIGQCGLAYVWTTGNGNNGCFRIHILLLCRYQSRLIP